MTDPRRVLGRLAAALMVLVPPVFAAAADKAEPTTSPNLRFYYPVPALNPAEGKWLYYVLVGPNGEHAFADTYEEFQRLKNSH